MNIDHLKRLLIAGREFDWEQMALEMFRYQARENSVYRQYLQNLGKNPSSIEKLEDIPFLPVEAFKHHPVRTGQWSETLSFLSSGTTQSRRAVHLIRNASWYDQNAESCLASFMPEFRQYEIVGLLPGYLENPSSSLGHMVKHLHALSTGRTEGKFLFSDMKEFNARLLELESRNRKILAFGVSFAWFDFANRYHHPDLEMVIVETGGMKTSARSILKAEIVDQIRTSFPKARICSEYGMTEMLSQAYSDESMRYHCGNSLRVYARNTEDPFGSFIFNQRGRLNIIDLANFDTCCFLETGDLGEVYEDGSFAVMGRVATEALRGCSLMYEA